MSLSDLASLGSFISAVAVVASLVFLYFQLRQFHEQVKQTERNQRSLINQGVASRDLEIMQIVQKPDADTMYAKAWSHTTEFTATEILHMAIFVRAVLGQMQDVHVQRSAGLIEQDTYDYIEAGVRSVLSIPLARAVWPVVRPTVSRGATALSETLLSSTPVGVPVDLSAIIKENLRSISAT